MLLEQSYPVNRRTVDPIFSKQDLQQSSLPSSRESSKCTGVHGGTVLHSMGDMNWVHRRAQYQALPRDTHRSHKTCLFFGEFILRSL